ncbi:MAG: S-layer homology domain-containing protein [Anaerovorax sp.]|nr:S-layer homology domain-containing protein [Anaerovorax sp.]
MKHIRILSWLLTLMMIFTLVPVNVFADNLSEGDVVATKSAEFDLETGEATVTLTVTGEDKETHYGADIILIVDESGSMSGDKGKINYTCRSKEYNTAACESTEYKEHACGGTDFSKKVCGSKTYYKKDIGFFTTKIRYFCSECNSNLGKNEPDANWQCENRIDTYICNKCGYETTDLDEYLDSIIWGCPNVVSHTCSKCGVELGAESPAADWKCSSEKYTCAECGTDLGYTKPDANWQCNTVHNTDRMTLAKAASKEFAANVLTGDNRLAIVGFSSSSGNNHSQGFTSSLETVNGVIDQFSANGGTNYTSALNTAIGFLNGRNKARPLYVVMMSDGAPGSRNGNGVNDLNWNGKNQAKSLKEDYSATIYTIGIGLSSDASALKVLSSNKDGEKLYQNVNVNSMEKDLGNVLDTIAGAIEKISAGRNTVMTDKVNLEEFEWVGFEGSHEGANYENGTITWDIGNTSENVQTLKFKIRLKQEYFEAGGTYNTNETVWVTYTDVDGIEGVTIPKEEIGHPNVTADAKNITVTYVAETGGSVSNASETIRPSQSFTGSTATPDAGYTFLGWFEGSDKVSDNAHFIPADKVPKTYTAKFAENTVTINYIAGENGKVGRKTETVGVVNGEVQGSTATADTNYHFVNWTDEDGEVASTEAAIKPDKADGTYTANFAEDQVTISYEAGAGGSIDETSEVIGVETGIAKGSTATPDDGYHFLGWFDGSNKVSDYAAFAPKKVDGVNKTKTYTAKFAETMVTINYVAEANGSVTNDTETVGLAGGSVQGSTAIPFENYHFVNWTDAKGNVASTEAAFKPDKADETYTANFAEDQVTIQYEAETGGRLTGAAEESVFVVNGNAAGSTVETLPGYTFLGWFDGDTNVGTDPAFAPQKVNGVNKAKVYTAKFEENEVTISYETELGGTVSRSFETIGASTGVVEGSTATADTGYTFLGWFDGDTNVGIDFTFVPQKVNGLNVEKTYIAKFKENEITIIYEAEQGGTVSLTKEVIGEVTGEIKGSTATANDGYTFLGWFDGDTNVGTDPAFAPQKVNGVNKAKVYTAKFEENEVTISYETELGGTVSRSFETIGASTGVVEGSTATADTGYTFLGWFDGDTNVGTDFTFVPQKVNGLNIEKTYTAKFEINSYEVVFVDFDGTELKKENVEHGKGATAPEDPSRAATAEYTYEFTDWDKVFNVVTEPLTVTALYKATKNMVINAEKVNVVYDGETHEIQEENLSGAPEEATITFGDNAFENVGEYTVSFKVEKEGYTTTTGTAILTITKRPITIKAGDATRRRNGEALTTTEYKITEGSLVEGHKENVKIGGSQTDVGSSASTVDSVVIMKAFMEDELDVTNNYEIKKENGTLTVTKKPNSHKPKEPEVTIEDEEVPLAGMLELNKVDHFNYVAGYPAGDVRPNNNITREEVAMIFYRLLTDTSRDMFFASEENFTDVASNRWSVNAIATLANGDIIKGYNNGTFGAGKSITRAEFATIASKFDALEEVDKELFTDVEKHWAKSYINSAATKGWIKGYEDGSFKPDQYITRAEAMTLINKVLERRINEAGLIDGYKVFPDNKKGAWYYYEVIEATNNHNYADRASMSDMETWTKVLPDKTWK